MNTIRQEVEIGAVAEALKRMADQADGAPASQAAAATNAAYTAAVAGDWTGSAPTTLKAAIDRLAVVVKALNGGTGA